MLRANAIAGCLALCACADAGSSQDLHGPTRGQLAVVEQGSVTPRLLMSGRLRAVAPVSLVVPEAEGWQSTIRWLAVDGAAVAAGDRVAEFDSTTITTELEKLEEQLRGARRELQTSGDQDELSMNDRVAAVETAKLEHERAQLLAGVPADLLPQREAQERQLQVTKAAVALAIAEKELDAERQSLTYGRKLKQITVKQAEDRLADLNQSLKKLSLYAPEAGTVHIASHPWTGARLVTGDAVPRGWTVVTLGRADEKMEVRATLSDVDDGRLALGQAARCIIDAFSQATLPCTVASISPTAVQHGRKGLRRGFDVVLLLDSPLAPELGARQGMAVKVVAETRADGLIVPRSALARSGGAAKVSLGGGGTRDVQVGLCDHHRCIVNAGLAVGDEVLAEAP